MMMQNISRKMENVADFPLKLNLQLFAEGYPELEDQPEFQEDAREYSKMNEKIDQFMTERAPKEVKEPVKEVEPTKIEPVKEEVTAVLEEVATPEPKPKQDAETNKAFQEMRQKLEAQEARAKKADELIAAQFGDQGIRTVEQYDNWIKEGKEQEKQERYKELQLTPEEIEAIEKYPKVLQETQAEQNARIAQENTVKWHSLYTAYPDLVESSKAFHEGKEPEWYTAEMKAEIDRGASPIAAYRNAHFDTILQKTLSGVKETATQEALDKLNSKDHLAPNASTGGEVDHVEIDPVQMQIYRRMTGKSDAEIRKFHKKQLAGG